MLKKILATILAGTMMLSCISVGAKYTTTTTVDKDNKNIDVAYGISVADDEITYMGVPTEKWDFANGEFTESLNGISSAEGRGYSSKYLSAKENKKYYLEVSNLYSTQQTATVKFTVKNKNNGMTANDENYMKMEYSFTTDGKGGFTAPMNFGNDRDFYLEITTTNPQSAKVFGTYAIRETDISFFTDISGHWAESTINKWANKGIISGYPDGTFKPDSPVTRAELAKILTLAFDLQPSEFVYNKRDLSEDAWYYNYLLCAGKYIPGYALPEINEKNQPYVDNRMVNAFLPEQNAMRMHVAEGLVEIKRNKEQSIIDVPDITVVKEGLNKTFRDADYEDLLANHGMIPENVRRMFEYTYLAKELDIMQGDTDGYFRPYDNITRAELITTLDRILVNDIKNDIKTEEKEWESTFVNSDFNDNSTHYKKDDNGSEIFDWNSGIKYVSGVAVKNEDGKYYLEGENINHLSWVQIGYNDYYGGLFLGFSMITHHLLADDEFSSLCYEAVTNMYDGTTVKENADFANEHFSVSINGTQVKIKAVGLGKGNGHQDYYFTLDTGIKKDDIKEIAFEAKV